MRILKKLLESKSFTSARDLDEFEEKPDDTVGMVMMLPSFTNNENITIRVTNVRKDIAIVEKDKHIAELIIVGKIKADIRRTYKSVEDVRIEDSKE